MPLGTVGLERPKTHRTELRFQFDAFEGFFTRSSCLHYDLATSCLLLRDTLKETTFWVIRSKNSFDFSKSSILIEAKVLFFETANIHFFNHRTEIVGGEKIFVEFASNESARWIQLHESWKKFLLLFWFCFFNKFMISKRNKNNSSEKTINIIFTVATNTPFMVLRVLMAQKSPKY